MLSRLPGRWDGAHFFCAATSANSLGFSSSGSTLDVRKVRRLFDARENGALFRYALFLAGSHLPGAFWLRNRLSTNPVNLIATAWAGLSWLPGTRKPRAAWLWRSSLFEAIRGRSRVSPVLGRQARICSNVPRMPFEFHSNLCRTPSRALTYCVSRPHHRFSRDSIPTSSQLGPRFGLASWDKLG